MYLEVEINPGVLQTLFTEHPLLHCVGYIMNIYNIYIFQAFLAVYDFLVICIEVTS